MNNQIELKNVIATFVFNELENQINGLDGVEKYKLATKYRMFKTWNLFLANDSFKSDFECSARDYLIVNNAVLKIPQYELSDHAKQFGLEYDKDNELLSAVHNYPKYMNSCFLNSSFMQSEQQRYASKNVNLETNAFVRSVSGFTTYKSEEQKMAVIGALKAPEGYTTLVSMTTGGGKSLVTQTVAYQQEGLTIVIVPTVSLMLDQVKNIKCKNKNEVLYYNSSSNNLSQIESAIKNHSLRMLFLSPEALIRNKKLYELISSANVELYLKNLVIDEAHMVMEWGALFRVDFQCLDIIRKELLSNNHTLRTYLLSATFSEEAVRLLKLTYSEEGKWLEIRCDRLRREPRFTFIKTSEIEKDEKAIELICTLPHPMIIYVQTPGDAERLKYLLLLRTGMNNIKTFTGRTSSDERNKLINDWTNDDYSIMVATCAFGVGVDKKDVRTVLHVYVPENANSYYQAAGRGGRDGLPCLSVVLYSDSDIDSAYNYIQKVLTTEKLIGRWFSMLEEGTYKGEGKYILKSTVKPKYRDSYEFDFWPNDGDVNWNVYVILFLKRCGLLKVDSMLYDEITKYTFEITLLEKKLRTDSEHSKELLNEHRQNESNRNVASFKRFRSALSGSSNQCVATLFNDVYGRTDEFCAGCGAHSEIHDFQSSKTLQIPLNIKLNKISERVSKVMHNACNELVLLEESPKNIIVKLIELGANAFVGPLDDRYFSDKFTHNQTVVALGYREFLEWVENSKMFLYGCVSIILPTHDMDLLIRILSACKRLVSDSMSFIFLAESNVVIPKNGKYLSELIEGSCIQSYNFEEECNNV